MKKYAHNVIAVLSGLLLLFLWVNVSFGEQFLIDGFEKEGNTIGSRSSTYVREPSKVTSNRTVSEYYGDSGRSLMLKYDKKGKGGPYGNGGWCGYYTQLKKNDTYFDATAYTNITFWIKGEKGGENFEVGLSDRHWDQMGDSVKSEPIGSYLPEGKVTDQWQKATVPLEEFFVDHKELASLAICFETECFPGGAGAGVIYIDELALE
jgi:hypothetical protein